MINLRIGVVGAGGMGSFHARTLAELPGVDVAVIADPFGDAAAILADELDATASEDALLLADSGAVDGLVIASPDDTHAEIALTAMAAGTPVLCEKPIATSLDDARRIVEFEVGRGERLLQLGFMREYDVAHIQLVEALGELGQIHSMRCVHLNTNSEPRSIDVIVGQSMVHDLHSVRYISGHEVVQVSAHATRDQAGSVRHVVALCALASGAHAVLEFDDSGFAYDVVVEAVADAGSVSTGQPTRAVVGRDEHARVHVGTDWFGRFADAYRSQDAAWIAGLRDGRTTGPSSWDGMVAQAGVEAILTAIDSGQPVQIGLPDRPPLFAG